MRKIGDVLHGGRGDAVEDALEVIEEYGIRGALEDERELRELSI